LARITLITGGARSGKSAIAERIAERACAGGRVAYVATAEPLDGEMRRRILSHRRRRPKEWDTFESPLHLAATVERAGRGHGAVIVDCLTVYVSNLLGDGAATDEEVLAEVARFAEAAGRSRAEVIVVTNEVGSGIVPDNALARRYRDLHGLANQVLAKAAARVVLAVSGVPVVIKGPEL
jgi:adenosylcobinamide kinase/adenosylcobinamide-phosphate guanylyltransferase